MTRILIGLGLSAALVLGGCGGGSDDAAVVYTGDEMLENGMTVKEMIEPRQHNLKDLGGAFKTVSDQIRSDEPNISEIQFATAEVKTHAENMKFWFPAETSPSSGVPTDALPAIWEQKMDFDAMVEQFYTASVTLDAAAQAGDVEGVTAAFRPVGGTCSTCHDSYRKDDD
ncbi:MAG: cytochrome C [Ponticaulis sp.]|nr:cytochrome C [Ponticaulis sp.]|tara:strand:+ start:26343 stop:26852 length:510 start_codon:yes stop_codon:yes gene_type:complete